MEKNDMDVPSPLQFISNPHLKLLDDDMLFHIGISTQDQNLKQVFGDVKFEQRQVLTLMYPGTGTWVPPSNDNPARVSPTNLPLAKELKDSGYKIEKMCDVITVAMFVCMGGSTSRIKHVAKFMHDELKDHFKIDREPSNLSKSDRYVLYKVGPVLAVNHGIGVPSLMVILHETLKLLHYAEAKDVKFFRIGTSGGLGLEPGTVVITRTAVNALLEPFFEQVILGKLVRFPATLNEQLQKQLLECSEDIRIAVGNTMCAQDFYEGQGRLDGAFCDYTLDDKLKFLQKVYDADVRNIEMESVCFAAVCNRAGVAAAIMCVTLLDRLKGDQVNLTHEQHEDFQMRPARLVAKFIKKTLEQSNGEMHSLSKTKRQKAD